MQGLLCSYLVGSEDGLDVTDGFQACADRQQWRFNGKFREKEVMINMYRKRVSYTVLISFLHSILSMQRT